MRPASAKAEKPEGFADRASRGLLDWLVRTAASIPEELIHSALGETDEERDERRDRRGEKRRERREAERAAIRRAEAEAAEARRRAALDAMRASGGCDPGFTAWPDAP